jgi:hypothetical protein
MNAEQTLYWYQSAVCSSETLKRRTGKFLTLVDRSYMLRCKKEIYAYLASLKEEHTVTLHDAEELDNDLRRGSDEDLALATALSVDDVVLKRTCKDRVASMQDQQRYTPSSHSTVMHVRG